MARRSIDWDGIEAAYMTRANVTSKDLSVEFGVSTVSINKRAAKYQWSEKRAERQKRIADQIMKKSEKLEVQTRMRHIQVAHAMLEPAIRRLRTLDPNDLSVSELRLYISEALEIERKALALEDGTGNNIKVTIEYVGGECGTLHDVA